MASRRYIMNKRIPNGPDHARVWKSRTRRVAAVLAGAALPAALLMATNGAAASPPQSVPVAGTGIHYFSTAIVHSQEPTETGMIQHSSDVVELRGDVEGYILYHPTSTFDFVDGTLGNTGTQVFSGTVLGSDPVILHDDRFRFDVDLATGATTGRVHLSRSADAPHPGHWYECDLEVTGTGMTDNGDATFDYTGTCLRKGRP